MISLENVKTLIKSEGKRAVLSQFAEILDKRAYVTIDLEGNIKRKDVNLILPLFALNDDEDKLADILVRNADEKERQNFDKIERFSSLDIEKVKKNFIKTVMHGNFDFAKKYGKELFLRDNRSFYEILATFVCIGNSNSLKGLVMLAAKELLTEYDDNIFTLFISYITKFRDDTQNYEFCTPTTLTLKDIKDMVVKDDEILNSRLGLGILSNIDILKKFNLKNERKIIDKMAFEIQNHYSLKPLTQEEKHFLSLYI